MAKFFFASDLHGNIPRYETLFEAIRIEKPDAVLLGGDLLPSIAAMFASSPAYMGSFVKDFLCENFAKIKKEMKEQSPEIFLIMGNDDPRMEEDDFISCQHKGVWRYIHGKKVRFRGFDIYGYSYVPPTPFLFKDWERYDVSRYVGTGCVAPEEGQRTVEVRKRDITYNTIANDLKEMTGDDSLEKSIFLFHSPPYRTNLDRADLDGQKVDHVPLDVHVGSIAIKRFIEKQKPHITLHGHIHESTELTGLWKEKIGRTFSFQAAHNGPELSLIKFDPASPGKAIRVLL